MAVTVATTEEIATGTTTVTTTEDHADNGDRDDNDDNDGTTVHCRGPITRTVL